LDFKAFRSGFRSDFRDCRWDLKARFQRFHVDFKDFWGFTSDLRYFRSNFENYRNFREHRYFRDFRSDLWTFVHRIPELV